MITIFDILDVKKYIDKVDGVIFDLDDTLYSEKNYVKSGYKAIFNNFNFIDNLDLKLYKAFEQGQMAIDVVFDAENLSDRKSEALNIYRYHKPDIYLYSGVEDMLTEIKSKNKKIGIITDGRPEGQNLKIDSLKLRDKVDFIIITDELGGIEYRKPNVIAFQIMQKQLQIPFEKMCYVGDNLKKDFIAPEALGMQSIYFNNLDGIYSSK